MSKENKAKPKSTKVADPSAKGNVGFLWGIVALLVIIAVVIGYIVVTGQQAKNAEFAEQMEETSIEVVYDDESMVMSSAKAEKDTPEVELYEDYSCPACAKLALATDADMKQAIEAGDLIVRVRPLNFLDGNEDMANNEGHSTKSAAALGALAKAENGKAYWNLRKVLLEQQQTIAKSWEWEDFADVSKQLGADDEAAKTIAAGDIALGQEIGSKNADRLKEQTGSVSSPRVIKDGKEFDGELTNWVKELSK